jgi:hypothetical protein
MYSIFFSNNIKSLFFILLLSCIFNYVNANNKNQLTKQDKAWKAKKIICEQSVCGHLVIDEANNCINECTSKVCYDEIYASNPLEDGEFDTSRGKKFINCMRRESKLKFRNKGKKSSNVEITNEVIQIDAENGDFQEIEDQLDIKL